MLLEEEGSAGGTPRQKDHQVNKLKHNKQVGMPI